LALSNFEYYNVSFKRFGTGSWLFVQGDVCNKGEKDYNTAVFRISMFDRKLLMWTGVFKIMGFKKRQTRHFEVPLDGFDYKRLPVMSKYEIYFETGF
jgi:hypothetical protein